MAQQLAKSGAVVSPLVLLDASTFGLQVTWTFSEQCAQWTRRLLARLNLLRQGTPGQTVAYLRERRDAVWRTLRTRLPLSRQVLDDQVKQVTSPESLTLALRLLQTMVDYSPKSYDGDMVLIRAAEYYSGDTAFEPRNGWGKFVKGKLTVHHVRGNHLTMLQGNNVDDMSRLLSDLFPGLRQNGGMHRTGPLP